MWYMAGWLLGAVAEGRMATVATVAATAPPRPLSRVRRQLPVCSNANISCCGNGNCLTTGMQCGWGPACTTIPCSCQAPGQPPPTLSDPTSTPHPLPIACGDTTTVEVPAGGSAVWTFAAPAAGDYTAIEFATCGTGGDTILSLNGVDYDDEGIGIYVPDGVSSVACGADGTNERVAMPAPLITQAGGLVDVQVRFYDLSVAGRVRLDVSGQASASSPPTATPTTTVPTAAGATFGPTASPTSRLPDGCGYGPQAAHLLSTQPCSSPTMFCCEDKGLRAWGLLEGSFRGSTVDIYLSKNRLINIPIGVFVNCGGLATLDLGHNLLTAIHADAFAGLDSLDELDLRQNLLTAIHADAFAGLNRLATLYLYHNQLTNIPAGLFAGLSSLQWLNLDYNFLTAIHADTFNFAGPASLDHLSLKNNLLTAILADTFAPLSGLMDGNGKSILKSLYLDRNRIVQMPVVLGFHPGAVFTLLGNPLKGCYISENTNSDARLACDNVCESGFGYATTPAGSSWGSSDTWTCRRFGVAETPPRGCEEALGRINATLRNHGSGGGGSGGSGRFYVGEQVPIQGFINATTNCTRAGLFEHYDPNQPERITFSLRFDDLDNSSATGPVTPGPFVMANGDIGALSITPDTSASGISFPHARLIATDASGNIATLVRWNMNVETKDFHVTGRWNQTADVLHPPPLQLTVNDTYNVAGIDQTEWNNTALFGDTQVGKVTFEVEAVNATSTDVTMYTNIANGAALAQIHTPGTWTLRLTARDEAKGATKVILADWVVTAVMPAPDQSPYSSKDARATTVEASLGTVVAVMVVALVAFRIQVYRLKYQPVDINSMQEKVLQSLGLAASTDISPLEFGITLVLAHPVILGDAFRSSLVAALRKAVPKLTSPLELAKITSASQALHHHHHHHHHHHAPAATTNRVLVVMPKRRLRPDVAEHTVEALLGLTARHALPVGTGTSIVDAGVAIPRRVPREIGRKHLTRIRQLGEGSHGQVHLYQLGERDTGIPTYNVAAKSVKAQDADVVSASSSTNARRMLLREAALGALLDHRNVLATVGVCTTPRDVPVLLLLVFCSEGTLEALVNSATPVSISVAERLTYVAQTLQGLQYIAARRIVHRDVAARNVLLDATMTCKISDFGMATVLPDDSKEYIRANEQLALRWSPPEVIEEGKYSVQSDAWSFGVLAFEVFACGALPYADQFDNLTEISSFVKEGGKLGRPNEAACPAEVYEQLMLPCFDADPTMRPAFGALYDVAVEHGAEEDEEALEARAQNRRGSAHRRQDAAELATATELLLLRGPSVHHLKATLVPAAVRAIIDIKRSVGHEHQDAFDELDDSSKASIWHMVHAYAKPCSAKTICPRDGDMGCAYVDTLTAADDVGPADALLSYAWGYLVAEVSAALSAWTERNARNPTQTRIWICSLCLNQHGFEARICKAGGSGGPGVLQKAFGDRVLAIGRILPMLEPWDDPGYVKRAWCMFELYTAIQKVVTPSSNLVFGCSSGVAACYQSNRLSRPTRLTHPTAFSRCSFSAERRGRDRCYPEPQASPELPRPDQRSWHLCRRRRRGVG